MEISTIISWVLLVLAGIFFLAYYMWYRLTEPEYGTQRMTAREWTSPLGWITMGPGLLCLAASFILCFIPVF